MKTLPLMALAALSLMTAAVQAAVKPAYQTEEWPDAPKLIWANPGTGGQLADAKNWKTESGKPAESAPDRNTDIVLPKSDKIYDVKGSRTNQVRHVTIESGARFGGGHRNEVEIWGNLEVKPGGRVLYVSIRGTKHTYVHLIGAEFPSPENGQTLAHPSTRVAAAKQCSSQISHKFQIAKVGTASVEFLGNAAISDEVMLQRGKLIVSGDFRWSGITGKGALEIYDGGILEIQSGGRIAPFDSRNNKAVFNINVYRNGTIQAGSPERPLTSDAYMFLGFAENDVPGRTGLYAALGSMVRVYSADPKKARLVVSSITSVPNFSNGKGQLQSNPDEKASGKKGIAMQLAGDVDFDNTVFDYVSEEGIGLSDPEQRKEWSNVSFGPNCAAAEGKLFSELKANPNSYYHARGDMKSEFALTVTAMKSMDEYLADADPFQLRTTPETTKIKELGKGKNTIRTPVAVIFNEPVTVTVTSKVPGAKMRYSTNGMEPTKDSPAYEGPITLTKTTRLMVKAYKLGVGFSPTFTTTYVIKP
ncbi:MAG: chitobiase/beta-hexosaminidase C-terminal domain-containing protein [Verrucomicrobiaceae bacterium]